MLAQKNGRASSGRTYRSTNFLYLMALKSAFGLPYIGRPMNHAKPRAVPCHWPIWARLATKARLLARSRLIYLPIDQFSLFYGAEKRVWPSIYRTTHRARKTACSSMPLAHVGLFGTTSSGTDKQDKYSQYRAMPLHTHLAHAYEHQYPPS